MLLAVSAAVLLKRRLPSSRPCSSTSASHASLSSRNATTASRIGLGEGLVLGGEHAAQAHPFFAQHLGVQARVRVELGGGGRDVGVDRCERVRETLRVASDERLAQLGLAGEVVVEAGLGEGQLGGHVRVAEAVEAADLDESFGGIEDARARVCGPLLGVGRLATWLRVVCCAYGHLRHSRSRG